MRGKSIFYLPCSLNTILISTQRKDLKLAPATAFHVRHTRGLSTTYKPLKHHIPHFDLMIGRGQEI